MRLLICVILAICLGTSHSQGTSNLKCFRCTDCSRDYGQAETCSALQEVCMKIVMGDHIIRRCGERELCGLGKAERLGNRIWTSISNVFKDVNEDSKLVYCCDDNYCNGAAKFLPSLAILLLPLVFVSLFKY